MAQANEKPDKTHDKLTKELNKLKIDLNNEGNMDTDLTKRQLRSRMIVVPTPRVLNASQNGYSNTTDPQSNTPQVVQVQSSHRFNFPENEGSHKDIKACRARTTKSSKTSSKLNPHFKSIKTHKHLLETQKKNNLKE